MLKYQFLLLEFILFFILKADDYPNDQSTTSTISVGGSHKFGNIEVPNDEDWFKVSLSSGWYYTVYNLEVSGSDPIVTVRGPSPSTTQIVYDDDAFTGRSAMATFKALSTGTYFIVAGCFSQHVGSYELYIIQSPCPTNCSRI